MFKIKKSLTLALLMLVMLPFAISAQPRKINSLSNGPVSVSLPNINAAQGTTITVPITVGDLTGRNAISFDLDVRFDPNVLRPVASAPTTNAGTLSSGFAVTANPYLNGKLLVSAFSAYPLSGQGTLLNLNFEVIGQSGTNSPLTWQSFMFNEGDPAVKLTVGGTTINTSPVSVALPTLAANPGAIITVPITVGDLTERNAISFDFDVRFNPDVLRPVASAPTTNAGTLSSGFVITANPNVSGKLLVSAFSAYPLSGQGTLLNLNFEVVGQTGNSPLTWQSFMFNEGNPGSAPTAGQFTVNTVVRPAAKPFDFDGDGKSDMAVFRPGANFWYRMQSTAGFAASAFGLSTDKIVPADYDGDGKTDLAVFRDGVWYWLNSSNGTSNSMSFGSTGDVPVPADYTGDGRAELAVFRAGNWYTYNLANGQNSSNQFGASTDKPVVADYDGDGKADQAVFRSGNWLLNRSAQGATTVQFGLATDKPVVGDFDGDKKADLAVFRNGVWYISRSTQGLYTLQFGLSTDIPIVADYDGDGKSDVAVFRSGVWYAFRSQSGFSSIQFGTATDKPIPAAFLP